MPRLVIRSAFLEFLVHGVRYAFAPDRGGLVRGLALTDAVKFGMAAGSATLLRPGTELCRREDAERLYREMAAT